MNARRRRRLQGLAARIEAVRAELHEVSIEEERALDSTPENLHGTGRARRALATVHAIEGIIDHLEAALAQLDKLQEQTST